jgi:hypothetical protein
MSDFARKTKELNRATTLQSGFVPEQYQSPVPTRTQMCIATQPLGTIQTS